MRKGYQTTDLSSPSLNTHHTFLFNLEPTALLTKKQVSQVKANNFLKIFSCKV